MTATLTSASGEGGVWLPIAELAKRKGIHRQSAMERVDRLEKKGLITTRREGRSRLVDLAAYDRAVGQVGDAAKEQGVETKKAAERDDTSSPRLRDAQTERAQYEARIRALDLADRLGGTLPVKGERGIERAMVRSAEAIVRALDQIPAWATDLMVAAKEGQPAVTRLLRERRHALRLAVTRALTELQDEGAAEEATGGIEAEIGEDDA